MSKLHVLGTPIRVEPTVLIDIVGLWGGISWLGRRRHPERGIGQAALIGLGETALLLPSDFGHAIAHIVSARMAGAPMDEVRISMGMPRTLYWNNAVSPDAHRMRALGGPVYSALCLLASGAIWAAAPGDSLAREMAGWSALGHGMIFAGSLAPLPIVDGGVFLKWTLVARGMSEAEADQIVERIDWAIGVAGAVAGLRLIAMDKRLAGAILTGLSAVVIGVAAGKIK